jgi:hypothetical protein
MKKPVPVNVGFAVEAKVVEFEIGVSFRGIKAAARAY